MLLEGQNLLDCFPLFASFDTKVMPKGCLDFHPILAILPKSNASQGSRLKECILSTLNYYSYSA